MKLNFYDSKLVFWPLLIVLIATTVICYWPVLGAQFINFDDDAYISGNPHVNGGLSLEGIRWAFTAFYKSNWHPLTWLGHMAAVSLFGLQASGHHLINLLLHLINIGLLFFLLTRATQSLWRSFGVAVLFALHPMHIESVAWIAELKDVLSTFFWFLTTILYVFYCEKRGGIYYWLSLIGFALGLLCKPMIITLPFTLILLDFWPLKRIPLRIGFWKAVNEKIPFFILIAASAVITFLAQKSGGAVAAIDQWSVDMRIANTLVNYTLYLWKLIVPSEPTIFYPALFSTVPHFAAFASFILLAALTLLVLRFNRRLPFLATGWFWFLGTLMPVIGLVQIGSQQIADRYTYIPFIGLFIILAWGLERLARVGHGAKTVCVITAIAASVFLATETRLNTPYWQDSVRLYERCLELTRNNFLIHTNLGHAFYAKGEYAKAESEMNKAVQIRPDVWNNHTGLGVIALTLKKPEEAIGFLNRSLHYNPRESTTYFNLGAAFAMLKDYGKAETYFKRSLELQPDLANAYIELGLLRYRECRIDEALGFYLKALKIDPRSEKARAQADFLKPMAGKSEKEQRDFCAAMEAVETVKEINRSTKNLNEIRKLSAQLKSIPKLPKTSH